MPRNCPRPEAGLSSGPQSGVAPAPLCSRRAPRLPARHACGSCRPQLSPGGASVLPAGHRKPLAPPRLHPRPRPGRLAIGSRAAGRQRAPLRLAALLHPRSPPSQASSPQRTGVCGAALGSYAGTPSLLGAEFSCWWGTSACGQGRHRGTWYRPPCREACQEPAGQALLEQGARGHGAS